MLRIAFCGIDGSGKSTAINSLFKELCSMNISSFIVKCPFESKKLLRMSGIDLHDSSNVVNIKRVAMAFEYVLFHNSLCLGDYSVVLYDRHTICYELLNECDSIPLEYSLILKKIYGLVPTPDIYIYCDISPNIAVDRIKDRGDYNDKEDNIAILKRLKVMYDDFFDKTKVPTLKMSFNTVDDIEKNIKKIREYVRRKLKC